MAWLAAVPSHAGCCRACTENVSFPRVWLPAVPSVRTELRVFHPTRLAGHGFPELARGSVDKARGLKVQQSAPPAQLPPQRWRRAGFLIPLLPNCSGGCGRCAGEAQQKVYPPVPALPREGARFLLALVYAEPASPRIRQHTRPIARCLRPPRSG